MQTFNKVPI